MSSTHEVAAVAGAYRPDLLFANDIWARIAASYEAFESPLVPGAADIRAFESAVAQSLFRRGLRTQAVMLGVTPGLALMKWPPGTFVTAVDGSEDVIGALWPGDVAHQRTAVCASWLCIPVAAKSCEVIVGDGSLNTFRFHDDALALIRAMHGLLVDGGILVLRVYVRPQNRETVSQVMDALSRGKGLAVDSFKMRLWMAMQRSVEEGVAVCDAARVLDSHGLDADAMRRLGWSDAAIVPFATWRTSDAVYSFPALDELHALASGYFDVESLSWPDYEMGHCCPTVVMRAR